MITCSVIERPIKRAGFSPKRDAPVARRAVNYLRRAEKTIQEKKELDITKCFGQ